MLVTQTRGRVLDSRTVVPNRSKRARGQKWGEIGKGGPRAHHSVANRQLRRDEGGREEDSDSSDWASESGGVLREARLGSGDMVGRWVLRLGPWSHLDLETGWSSERRDSPYPGARAADRPRHVFSFPNQPSGRTNDSGKRSVSYGLKVHNLTEVELRADQGRLAPLAPFARRRYSASRPSERVCKSHSLIRSSSTYLRYPRTQA